MVLRLAIKPLTHLQEFQALAQQTLRRHHTAPARYGTAFHIRPPHADVREWPGPAQAGQASLEDFKTLPGEDRQRIFALPLATDPYLAWLVAHMDAIDTRIVHVKENETRLIHFDSSSLVTGSSFLCFILEPGASLDVTDMAVEYALGLRRMFVWQKEASNFSYMGLRTSNQFWNERLRVELRGREAKTHLTHLTHGQERSQSDITVQVSHEAPATTSALHVRAVGMEHSVAVYRGLIRIVKAAGNSEGYQAARGLLASAKAVIDILPELEIETNDVRCSHGVNITHLDPSALFYLRSRGLSEAEARKLALLGFYNDGLSIPAPLHNHIQATIRNL